MSKFANLISSNNALQRRAAHLEESTKLVQKNLINNFKSQIADINLKISALNDLAPDSTTSTMPGAGKFDPTDWVTSLQEFKEELWRLEQSLKIAEDTYKEYFESDLQNG